MNFNADILQKTNRLRKGELTCLENTKHFLTNIEKNNKKFNIVLELNKEAEKEARNLDEKRKRKERLGKLFGLTFLIKSNMSIKGMRISCASKTLEDYTGTFDADVIRRIKEEDGIILGIVNNDEFASGSSGESSAFGLTRNPTVPERIPGGSSSGSAAAIAADFSDLALGSDTGGSVRNPASHCGIVGIKPTYGRVSRYGLVDLSMSLDHIGPLSKDIYGSALTLSVLSGISKNDPTTEDMPVEDYTDSKPEKTYRIGIIKAFDSLIVDDRIRLLFQDKIKQLKEKGHDVIELDIKYIDIAVQAYYPIVYTEFFSGTRKFDGIKYGKVIEKNVNEEALRRILGGKEISRSEFDGAYYKKALMVKEVIAKEFEKAFKKVDFILTPVTPILPHRFGTALTPEEMYGYDVFTVPANLAGICAGVISKDRIEEDSDNVFVGVQVLCDKFKERQLFQALTLLDNLN